jgi:hypothetical protein
MPRETKSRSRDADTPRDKPITERTEHANLERPGAQAHPRARGWTQTPNPITAWRLR